MIERNAARIQVNVQAGQADIYCASRQRLQVKNLQQRSGPYKEIT